MTLYTSLLRPLLFRLSADRAHELGKFGLRLSPLWAAYGQTGRAPDPRLRTSLAGIELASPVGFAPGFDKDGSLSASLRHLGFGYLMVGSATPLPCEGNPKPRLGHDLATLSTVNWMGLPNPGIPAVVERLRTRPSGSTPVIVSVTTFTPDDMPAAVAAVAPYADGVEVNPSCPNISGLRATMLSAFEGIVQSLPDAGKPVFVKLPPVHSLDDEAFVLSAVDTCLENGIAGVSVYGARREPVPALAGGQGSINGRSTFDDALRTVIQVAERARGGLAIKASGGVFTGEHAATMLAAGATTVEVYSSFIFEGPGIARSLNRELGAILDTRGCWGNMTSGPDSGAH